MNKKNKTTFKSAHIPLRLCFKLALKNMWKKKFRFLIVMIICSISLAFLSFTIELNGDKLRQNVATMIENGYRYTDIKKYEPLDKEATKKDYYNKFNTIELPDNSYDTIKSNLTDLTIHNYEEVSIDYVGKNIENATFFYPGKINSLIMFDDTNDYNLIAGRLPNPNKKEILITDYLVYAFNYFNIYQNCNNYYDYLYKYINLNVLDDYQIVGIINTNFDKWQFLSNSQVIDIDETEKTNYSFINDFLIMNAVFIPKQYFDIERVDVSGNLLFTSNGINRSEWTIKNETNSYDPNQLSFRKDNLTIATRTYYGSYSYPYGVNPTAVDEIAIPYSWVKPLYDREFDRLPFWVWEESIYNTTLTITITSADKLHTKTMDFKVVGIVQNDSKCLISEALYNELDQTFSQQIQKVVVELPNSSEAAYNLFNKAYKNGYVINVWEYRNDIDSYTVDPFINIISKAGLVVFVAFSIGIMWTIITIEIVDSKKEIGILRSIGLSGFKVSSIFIIQALIINLISYIGAIFIAKYAIAWYNGGLMDELNIIHLYMYTMTYRTPVYLLIFVLLITVISTCLPLYKIMSQKIIDVINERE